MRAYSVGAVRCSFAIVAIGFLASCHSSTEPDLSASSHNIVMVGERFTVTRSHFGDDWILPPPISTGAVVFLQAVPSQGCGNCPAPGGTTFSFQASTRGEAVITLQEIYGADSSLFPPYVDTVIVK